MKKLNQIQVVQLLRKRQGQRPAKELASELGISAAYLSEIFKGSREPGPSVLEKLGLRRETVYVSEVLANERS